MTAQNRNVTRHGYAETPIQKTASAVGVVFLLVGVAGFIPGITHAAHELQGAGSDSPALLLGVFQVSILHNALHLLSGVAGVVVASRVKASRQYLIWGGVAYSVLWIYGMFAIGSPDANVIPVNTADNWLHLVLGAGMILLGVLVDRHRKTPRDGH